MQKDISELITSFEEWYKNDVHSQSEDYYADTITADHLKNLSRAEFFEFITQFVHEGGKIQSGGNRSIKKFKKLIKERENDIYNFLLEPFQADFDVFSWLERIEDFKGFGQGAATIYLNRIDKTRYVVVNNKSMQALEKVGVKTGSTLLQKYQNIYEFETQLIEQYPSLDNYFKADALTHFMIGVEKGRQLVEKIFQPTRQNIEKLISDYKALKRTRGHSDEFYKYQAIQHFQDHWDIEAQDFASMLKNALKKHVNLIYQNSQSSLNAMADADPDRVRDMFRDLYDENKELNLRMSSFQSQASKIIKEAKPDWQSQQDERALGVYLSFRYPEKYYIFKDSFYGNFATLFGQAKKKTGSKYLHYLDLMQEFKTNFVKNDQELWDLTNATLPGDAWPDTARNVLAQDILYCMLDKKETERSGGNNDGGAADTTNAKAHSVPKKRKELNTILYGPPGTGKTYALKSRYFSQFTEKPKTTKAESKIVKRYEFVTFHQSYSYEDFIEGIKPVLEESEGGENTLAYEIKDGVFKSIAKRAQEDPNNDYALFIDEINRGNVAATFGELITLIEEDKRAGAENELTAVLPYSRETFSVPPNLFIIATMNTADRSVEALDTALRRRFQFEEITPDSSIIQQPKAFEVDLKKVLETINLRIEKLLNKDHCIGHSYFINIDKSDSPLTELKRIFANKIIPLLEEYFYGNMGKIGSILGKSFVEKVEHNIEFARGFTVDDFEQKEIYRIRDIKNLSTQDFVSIYEATHD